MLVAVAVAVAQDDSIASGSVDAAAVDGGSSSSGSSSPVGESQDCGGSGHNGGEKPSSSVGVHPSNTSLEHLLSTHHQEAKPSLSGAPSVFVIDDKHAQHYCQFSPPKKFAIRPKQQSCDLVQPNSSSSESSGGDSDVSSSSSSSSKRRVESSRLDDQPKQDEQELSSPPSSPFKQSSPPLPSSSMTTGDPMTIIPPSPKKSSTMMVASTSSSSSLCFPLTPRVLPSPMAAATTHAITPIANNAAITHNNNLGTSKILAVNFSESYEAFSRLSNKFWPGPMIIYAPALKIRVGNDDRKESSSITSLRQQQQQQQQKEHNCSRSSPSTSNAPSSSSSCPSLPSFTNLQSLEAVGKAGNIIQVHVLPPSVLIPARDLLLLDRNDDVNSSSNTNEQRFFIGMQCPSHPLSRKILTEIHRPRGSFSSSSSSIIKHSTSTESLTSFSSLDTSNFQQHRASPGIAVVGSYISPLTVGSSLSSSSSDSRDDDGEDGGIITLADSAANVTKILSKLSSSSPPSNNSNVNRIAEQIYVVNGEDTTRESFSVPTCNYGGVSPISLVVDGDNRTIYLLRHHQGGDGSKGCNNNFNNEKIYRALLQPPSSLKSAAAVNVDVSNNKAASKKEIDRVITAVLSRWKVVERDV